MADEELEAIRARRMAELQAQYGAQDQSKQVEEQAKAKQRQEEMKNSVLTQILEQNARARLNSIALVKPEKARAVENLLIQMAQTGQLAGKVGEAQLVELLEKFSQQTQKKTTVKFERKRLDRGDSDEDY